MSIYFKDIDMIRLSLYYGANVHINCATFSPIYALISYNIYSNEEIKELTELFISYGAYIDSKAMFEKTPLICLAEENNEDLVKFFVEKGRVLMLWIFLKEVL